MASLIPWKKKRHEVSHRNGNTRRFNDDFFPISHLRSEFDHLIDRFWDDWGSLSGWGESSRPAWNLDWEDKEAEYLLHAELPGFEPDEIDVSVSGNVMTIRAERNEDEEGKNGSSYRYGHFSETFTLPSGVETDKIDAKYHNGVLNVHLPKGEECKAKRIAVKKA